MTSLKFVFCLTCLFMGKMAQKTDLISPSIVHQARRLLSVNVGDKVTLQCVYEGDDSAWLFWYKQTLGQRPKLISSFYVYDKIMFHNEFKNNQRFTLERKHGTNNLNIADVIISDSATYYCATSYTFVLSFAEGTTLNVQDSDLNTQPLVHQSASEPIQPGAFMTLNCTVHTGSCDGEHSVYWFKDSDPGIIYTHGDRNDQCERKPDTQTNTCIYNLSLKNLTLSHIGTYYCAVASCGHILFGNGTEVDIEHKVNSPSSLVYYLSGALIFTTILVVSLAFSVCNIIKRNNCQCTEFQARLSAPSTNQEEYRDIDNLHYAALSVNLPNRSRKQRSTTKTECVYSSVKQ
ncbi:uncharacterized protein LOC113157732 [Anabas testudineus]|uniref:Ig-like domain-containing protein n=1 Tax=Anabas testudineus TaxID=64144 RepID=A0A3Q1J7C4_ANATE|nr:uncharacterized protein LOC113157732 [Anabas testudineus]